MTPAFGIPEAEVQVQGVVDTLLSQKHSSPHPELRSYLII